MAEQSTSFTIPTLKIDVWGTLCHEAEISITNAEYVCLEDDVSCVTPVSSSLASLTNNVVTINPL